MESIKFYCENKPATGEVVQVIFTERRVDHAIGYMTEYNCNVLMTFGQATKKKRIRNINKIIPLNKELTAVLEDYDQSKCMANVSRAYLDDDVDNHDIVFKLNKKLYIGIQQICESLKIDFNDTWKNKIFPFVSSKYSELIKEGDFDDDEKPSYFDVFVETMKELESDGNEKLVSEIESRFKRMNVSTVVNKKKVGIISNNGVSQTKRLFELCFEDENFSNMEDNFSITYSTPDFTIETKLPENILNNFVELLSANSQKLGNMYVKIY